MYVCMYVCMYVSMYVKSFNLNIGASEKLGFEMELCLVSSQSWVKCPKHLCMWPGGDHLNSLCLVYAVCLCACCVLCMYVHYMLEYSFISTL